MGAFIAPFFMTITITVDDEAITSDWQAQQESKPLDPQPIFISSEDKTTAEPAPEGGGGEPVAATTKTRSTKK